MPTADLRPLLRVNPADTSLLGVGLGLEIDLHPKRHDAVQTQGRPWELDAKARRAIFDTARAHIAGLAGWLVEPYASQAIASTLPDPNDLEARIAAGQAAALALVDGSYRLDATGLVQWMLLPALMRGKFAWYPDLTKFDPVKALEYAALRRRAFAPWLDGRVAVRNIDAFRDFHLSLDPAEQTLLKRVVHQGSVILKDPTVEPATAWAWNLRARLTTGGWIKQVEKPVVGAPAQRLVSISTNGRRLAPGELGLGY